MSTTWEVRETARAITRRANRKPWYKRIDWLSISAYGMFLMWSVFLILLFCTSLFDATSSPSLSQHYNTDFKRYCNELYAGHAYVGDRDICMNAAGKVVMRESANNGASVTHYNNDFARYCRDDNGQSVIRSRNICVKDNRIVMQESKN